MNKSLCNNNGSKSEKKRAIGLKDRTKTTPKYRTLLKQFCIAYGRPEVFVLLWRGAASLNTWCPTFRDNLVVLTSKVDESTTLLWHEMSSQIHARTASQGHLYTSDVHRFAKSGEGGRGGTTTMPLRWRTCGIWHHVVRKMNSVFSGKFAASVFNVVKVSTFKMEASETLLSTPLHAVTLQKTVS